MLRGGTGKHRVIWGCMANRQLERPFNRSSVQLASERSTLWRLRRLHERTLFLEGLAPSVDLDQCKRLVSTAGANHLFV